MRAKLGRPSASSNSHLSTQPGRDSKRFWLIAFLLVVITAAVYSPVLWHPFVNYDDQSYVVENDHIHSGLSSAMLRWALTSLDESNWHPVTWLSHALDCQVYGLNPAVHHATGMILHALNAALLLWLLFRATGSRWRSLAVAGLFALHPLNVESVAWVAERKNVLSMFFLLLTMASYGWYARKPGAQRYLAVAILFAAGLAAKPMIVPLPCALLLLDYWPLGRVRMGDAPSRESPFAQTSWQRLVLITLRAQKMSMATTEALPFSQRLSNAIYSYVLYLWKVVWPAHLAVFYPRPQSSERSRQEANHREGGEAVEPWLLVAAPPMHGHLFVRGSSLRALKVTTRLIFRGLDPLLQILRAERHEILVRESECGDNGDESDDVASIQFVKTMGGVHSGHRTPLTEVTFEG